MHKNTIVFDNSGANLGFKSKAALQSMKNQINKINRRNGNTEIRITPKQRLSVSDMVIAAGVNAGLAGSKPCKGCNKKKVVKSKDTLDIIATNSELPVVVPTAEPTE